MTDTIRDAAAPPEVPEDEEIVPTDLDDPPSGLSRWQIAVLGAALAFLAGAVGFVLGDRTSGPPTSAVDTGFLQDMIDHHEQAVTMASIGDASATDPTVRLMARDVLIFQRYEIGLMDGYLSERELGRGDPERLVMGWMGAPPLSLAEMPGLATPEQVDELQAAEGVEVDRLFLELMRAHHTGGIHMAEYAARHADDPRIRDLAETIADAQRHEVREYDLMLERLVGRGGFEPP